MCHPDTVLSRTVDPPQASFAGSSTCLWEKDTKIYCNKNERNTHEEIFNFSFIKFNFRKYIFVRA